MSACSPLHSIVTRSRQYLYCQNFNPRRLGPSLLSSAPYCSSSYSVFSRRRRADAADAASAAGDNGATGGAARVLRGGGGVKFPALRGADDGGDAGATRRLRATAAAAATAAVGLRGGGGAKFPGLRATGEAAAAARDCICIGSLGIARARSFCSS